MKAIFKLFPVALAVVALASCSDDNLLTNDGEQFVKDPNNLYVTVDPLQDGMAGDVTRAGFVYGTTAAGSSAGQYLVWTAGDEVKLYDYENNWRPQIWKFDPAATEAQTKKYSKSEGFSVFTKDVKVKEGYDQYTNGYGIIPASMGKFIDEDRSQIEFDLSSLACYDLSQTAVTDIYADGKLAKAPIPMWGVATSGEMKVKYLTGILKVDIANLPDPTTQSNYLLILANDGTTGIKLHEKGIQTDKTGADAFDPENTSVAPVLKGSKVTPAAKTGLGAIDITNLTTVPADAIVVKLGKAKGRTCVAVPVPAIAGAKLSAYWAKAADNATSVTFTAANQIGDEITKDVEAGKFYLIADEGAATIADANTPFQLAERIKAIDATMDRDYTITISADVNVDDTGDDEHGFVVDLSGYSLKHNANVVFSGAGFKGKTANANTLWIRTGDSGNKTLTLTVAETTALKAIKFEDDTKVAGKVILQGTLHTIEAGSSNLTIADAVTTVNATNTVNFDAAGKAMGTLNLYAGANNVNVLNGTITKIEYTPQSTVAKKTENVTGTVNVYSEGISGFEAPVATTAAAKNGTVTFEFTSKLTETPAAIKTAFATEAAASIATVGGYAEIYTAAQLAAITNSGKYVVKAKEIDLNGEKIAWAPINLTVDFDGNINANVGGTPAPANVPTVIKNMKVAATTAATPYGLFGTITAAATPLEIKNLKIQDATIEGAKTVVVGDLGLLAGTITGTAANDQVNFTNIVVSETNSITTDNALATQNLGGLIGSINAANTVKAVLKDINVSGVSLKGYKNLGGVIGFVGDKGNVKFAANGAGTAANPYRYNSASSITFTSNVISNQSSQDYATRGDFVGSADKTAVLEFEVESFPAIGAAATTKTYEMGEWNVMNKTTYANIGYPISLRQNFIGFAGIDGDDSGADYHAPAATGFVVQFTTLGTGGSTKNYSPQPSKYVATTDATKNLLLTIEN